MKLNILFILSKSKLNKKGRCPIKCRLTFNKVRHHFSTRLFVKPNCWITNKQIVILPDEDENYINTQLSLIRTKLSQAFLMLQIKEERFTAEDVFKLYKGEKTDKEYNVIELFERYLKRLKTLVNIDIAQVTWNKYYYIKNDVKSFIK
ncbi:recombinase [Olleya sp. AH-315-F22]|nr:recombinase [Olleya sp. AH-315-F22]